MIKYETDSSPFFAANKNYCEIIDHQLNTINSEFSGYCNSFGYDIETTFKQDNLTFSIKFHKYQSTQNGVIIPVNALDYMGVVAAVTGLDKKYSVTIGKSSFRRLFMAQKFKNKIPNPYFITSIESANDHFIDELVKIVISDKISDLKISNGVMMIKIHQSATDSPLDLMTDIEKISARLNLQA